MSTWRQRERDAAKALGTRRVRRAIGESAPDVEPVRLASGEVLSVEVKHRAKLPALLTAALAQAARYAPAAVPVAVVSQRGGRQLACLSLANLARLLGIASPEIPTTTKRKARAPKVPRQPMLPGSGEPE